MNQFELLEGLVRHSSPSRQEHGAVQFLVEQMGQLGFKASMDAAGNAVGVLGQGTRTIVLLGHIDTFNGEIKVRIEGNNLYGRGSVDAKGCLATFVSACAQVGARDDIRWVVIGAVEEECATSKGARYAVTQYQPESCIIGEPSGWDRITLGYKGRLLIDYQISKPMTHTASGALAAAEEAVGFWLRVSEMAAAYNVGKERTFDRLDPSLRNIRSEDDGLLDRAALRVGLRIPLGVEMESLERDLAGLAQGGQVAFSSEEPPFRAGKNNSLVRGFLSAIRAEQGSPGFTLKTGTADMNIAGPVWHCPIVAYGPGDSRLDHTPDEHLDLDEYERAVRVLARVLQSL